MFDRRLITNFDWFFFILVVILCLIGWSTMYAATYNSPTLYPLAIRQIYWFAMGFVVMFAVTLFDYRLFVKYSWFLYMISLALLAMVLFWGTGGQGSSVKRWLRVGGVFIQPSELTKYALVLVLASYFSHSWRIGKLGFIKLIIPSVIVGIPFVMILKQPDLGTSLLLLIVFIVITILVGLQKRVAFWLVCIAVASAPIAWQFVLKPYQKDRILTFVAPERDPLGSGYHVSQSKIAVGSGMVSGRGFLEGTQGSLNFLPAHHTDFIFAIFAEEQGFIGSMVVLFLFLLLLTWPLSILWSPPNRSSVIITVGVVFVLASQIFVNIDMVLGLLPVVGVPLPFFSYGGSSMLSSMFGIGLLLNVRMRRFEKNKAKGEL